MNTEVAKVFDLYSPPMTEKLLFLRQLILDAAKETPGVGVVTETLKWGQPSYLSNQGSTIRLELNKDNPQEYMLFFHCKTKLVDKFKERYRDHFTFVGNRAIVFHKNDVIPLEQLKHCIALSLIYHRIKHLSMLGV